MLAMTSVVRHPNMFLVGAPKCGTTSLWAWLGQHPDIFMSPEKEPSFFSRPLDDPSQRLSARQYFDLFRGASGERWVGEATVSYLRAPGAADRIRSFSPEARIFICIREPVSLIVSTYQHERASGREPATSLAQAVQRAPGDRARLKAPRPPNYLETCSLSSHIERYLQVFGTDAVHLVALDDMIDDPSAAFQVCCNFLQIDPSHDVDLAVHNQARSVRTSPVAGALRRLGITPAQLKDSRVRRRLRQTLGPRAWSVLARPMAATLIRDHRPPPPDPAVESQLRDQMREEATRLNELSGRDLLARWGYTA